MIEEGNESSKIEEYGLAAKALTDALKIGCGGGRFGKFAFASLNYLSQASGGERLAPDSRNLTMAALALGVQINDYYDMGSFKPQGYLELLRSLKSKNPERYEDFRRYRRETSKLEKNRPDPQVLPGTQKEREEAIIKYREQIDRLSLAFCCSMAFDRPLKFFFEKGKPEWFEPFFHLVMASQVIDDYIGRKGDLAHNRPSFYTMLSSHRELETQEDRLTLRTRRKMMGLFFDYVKKSKDNCPGFMAPIRSAIRGMVVYPPVVDLVRAIPSLEKVVPFVMTKRDRHNW